MNNNLLDKPSIINPCGINANMLTILPIEYIQLVLDISVVVCGLNIKYNADHPFRTPEKISSEMHAKTVNIRTFF
jgi:hypothetical protein